MYGLAFLIFFSVGDLVLGQSFLSLHTNTTRSTTAYPGCSQVDTESCVRADVDLDLLQNGDFIELPDGTLLELITRGEHSAVFKGEGAEAIFNWHGDIVVGSVHVKGESWILQGCGEQCFLWIKQTSKWQEESLISSSKTRSSIPPPVPDLWPDLIEQGEEDSETMVSFSVMIWYTPEFRATFISDEEMMVFIDLIFTETNQGYINSEIPLTAVKHDVKLHPTLNDLNDSSVMLDAFSSSMPLSDLLSCADSTALLIEEFNSCGIAYLDRAFSCGAISVTKKSCATGYYSFGHEIGHNFGAQHNPEQYSSTDGDGYGHLIQPTSSSVNSGYRTILAYRADGHAFRVNHYSNPDVQFNNNPTGIVSVSNNARLITDNRFAMASCGTEEPNGECNDCSVNPANEPCLNCCETVTITSTDATYLASGYRIFAATYTKYNDTLTLNGRMVYKLETGDYCLYFASTNKWVINDCPLLGSTSSYMRTDATNKQCVHADGLVWEWNSGKEDPTMSAECSVMCSEDPPAVPSGASSDWDGTTKTAGTIITYSCDSSSTIKKSTCDPTSASWTPAVIPADLCGSETTTTGETPVSITTTTIEPPMTTTTMGETPVPMTTTTFEPTMTTTTPVTPTTTHTTMSPTTTSFKGCGMKNKVPFLKNLKKTTRVATAEACQKMCQHFEGCQYFKWKTNRIPRKRTCWLMTVGYKIGNRFTAGPVNC